MFWHIAFTASRLASAPSLGRRATSCSRCVPGASQIVSEASTVAELPKKRTDRAEPPGIRGARTRSAVPFPSELKVQLNGAAPGQPAKFPSYTAPARAA